MYRRPKALACSCPSLIVLVYSGLSARHTEISYGAHAAAS
jgi:hypothetical protein